MSFPTISFIFNHDSTDSPYLGTGEANGDWRVINTAADTLVFTGGGIDDNILTTPTCASGTRSATIKPSSSPYVIPYVYIESGSTMYHIPMVGKNQNRYVMGAYINGTTTSDLYLESWDDQTFSTTNLEVLQGSTTTSGMSFINAIRTTDQTPPVNWNGGSTGAAYLRGSTYRVRLGNQSTLTDEAVYYNIYIQLPTDCTTFHNLPVLAFRYLYT